MDPVARAVQLAGALPAKPYTSKMLIADCGWGAPWRGDHLMRGHFPTVWRENPGGMAGALRIDWVRMRIDRRRGWPGARTQHRQRIGRPQ